MQTRTTTTEWTSTSHPRTVRSAATFGRDGLSGRSAHMGTGCKSAQAPLPSHGPPPGRPVPGSFLTWLGLCLLAFSCASCNVSSDPQIRSIDAADDARAANQLAVSGNACGPAALLNSLRFADDPWRNALASIDGETDRGQLHTLIRRHGLRPSPHMGGRPRWNRRGINVADLTDVANEITAPHALPPIRHEILIKNSTESPSRQLARTHRLLETSLAHGLPPILSVRRFALRGGEWTVIDAHFVSITEVSRRLLRNAESFSITYIDPWGGEHHQGEIRISMESNGTPSPFPEANLPNANVGKNRLRAGETSILAASAVIGRP